MLRKLLALIFVFTSSQAFAWTPPVPVVVATQVEKGSIQENMTIPGSFKAIEDVTIRAKTEGQIMKVAFEDGVEVKEGQLLFQIDDQKPKASLKKAQADVKVQDGQLKRSKELFSKGFLSQAELDKAEAQASQAEAQQAIAEDDLSKTMVTAPFDGVLSGREVSTGAYVKDYDSLVHLQSLNPIRFEFQIPVDKLSLVKLNQAITVTTDAHPGQTFAGKIVVIDPRADSNTRNVKVLAELENENAKLIVGMYGNISISTDDTRQTLVIPEEALVVRRDGLYTYRIDSVKEDDTETTKSKLVKVNVGTRSNDQVEIISGLKEGDQIVLQGQDKIQDNADIEVYKPQG